MFTMTLFTRKPKRFIPKVIALLLTLSVAGATSVADEGMWQPHQLPDLSDQLRRLGLEINPENLSRLDQFPMNAVVSLGGCSASFVSPQGLVVTNHHCIYGSVQYNSTPENNLLEDGFLAKQLADEIPTAPGTRVYVTEEVTDVTSSVLADVTTSTSGIDRYNMIESNRKSLIANCESSSNHRCGVSSFHQGLEYFLIKRLEVRDVRLVYAPATSIGKYGGDIDNWQWPRHTGDFGFYRAYVGTDGRPAEYSENNVPYSPASFLEISSNGLEDGDFVMGVGYPGGTNRYRTTAEVENEFEWYYPKAREFREDIINIINENSADGSAARIAYEGTLASLNNYSKNFQSMVESYGKSDFIDRRTETETDLFEWINSDSQRREQYAPAVGQLEVLIDSSHATRESDLIRSYMGYATLPSAAHRLYRLAMEKQKPDAEREPGYQERDLRRLRQSMQAISRRFDETVDKATLSYLLSRYAELPEQYRSQATDSFFGISSNIDRAQVEQVIEESYAQTSLNDEATRLAWLDSSVEAFESSKDPLIRFAVASYSERIALELESKELRGQFQRWRPKYMEAVIAYNRSLGQPIYADANSSLRVTFGQVRGNQPKDGLINQPFTSLEGILGKDTGVDPFNAPEKQLDLIRSSQYGDYALPSLGTVPVNFLSTLDITGGNSGTAAMNSKAQLVGLLFDGVYESIIGDWDFDDTKNRAISVDARYMLWVMEYMDDATNLLEEMTIVK